MANLLKKILSRSSSLDAIPLSRILLLKDLVTHDVDKKSYEEQEINELW